MANQFPAIVAQKLRSRKRKVAKKKSMQVSPTLVVKVEPKSDPVGEFSTRDPFDQSSNVQSSDAGILTPQQFVYAWTAMQMV